MTDCEHADREPWGSNKCRECFSAHWSNRVDVVKKLKVALRNRLRTVRTEDGHRVGGPVISLGCSIEDFILYLEEQFEEGMTWQNFSSEWSIDHIQPLSGFHLPDREQFLRAVHHSNLQPLWGKDNRRKGRTRINVE